MEKAITTFVLLLCLASAYPCLANPQSAIRNSQSSDIDPVSLGKPAIRLFAGADDLPQLTVLAVAVDRKGYLWIGMGGGAAYYNGRKWTAVKIPNKTASNPIYAILPSTDGSIWFGTQGGGALKLKDGVWTSLDADSGLPSNVVWDFLETTSKDGSSVLWIATTGGLARLENGRWTKFDTSSGLPNNEVISLTESVSADGSQALWVGTNGGLARFEQGRWTVYDTKSGLPDNRVQSLLETTDENGKRVLWAGTNGGLARLEDGKWTKYDKNSGLPDNTIHFHSLAESVSPDGTRTLWVGTLGGLARLKKGIWTVYDAKSGLPANSIFVLKKAVSSDGSFTLWIGTNGGGLARLEENRWASFDAASGLPSNVVYGMLESVSSDGKRAVWICTYGGGLARLENGKWTVYDAKSGMRSDRPTVLLESVSGSSQVLWAGMGGGGLARLENGRWTVYDNRSGLPNNFVNCLLETVEDGGRTLWAGTSSGLAALKDGKWTVYRVGSGLPDNTVISLLETISAEGVRSLWVGTLGGLARLEKGKWTVYNAASGLPSSSVPSLHFSRMQDGKRYLWIGTLGGVCRIDLDSNNASQLTLTENTKPALPDNFIYQIREDAKGRIYLFTNKGVARLTPRSPTPDDPSEYSIYMFTKEDGLPSNECNQNGSMVDSLGRIWAGTAGGAAVFDPNKEIEDRTPKPLYIERTILGGIERAIEKQALSYKENNIAFEFALLSLFRQKETRFQTQLEGFDEKPSGWTDKPERIYTNLPDGDYRFKVWGRDYAGNITGPVETVFKIKPAPWRTWQAYFFYFAAAMGIGYGGYRYRLRAFERRNRELETKVNERTAELAEQKEELARQKEALANRNEELVESQKRADRIFSALADALPGTVLDEKYRLDEKIGSGGFGAVYRAVHLTIKRPVAVKVFKPSPGNDSAEALERFRLEAVSAGHINHPNAVAVLDSGISAEGIAYLAMELLSGHTLKQELMRKGRLSLARTTEILIAVSDLLSKAHSIGIIHRDVKPENVFLHKDADGEIVKVVDFGIAKLMGEEWGTAAQSLTGTGALIGTPTYISPERLSGKDYDGKADVYSFGALIYEMLCGKPPFHSNSGPWQIAIMHLTLEPPPLRQSNPSIPALVEAAVMRALIKDPAKRPSADEFKREFLAALDLDPDLAASGNFREAIYKRLGAEREAAAVDSESPETGPTIERKIDDRSERWRRIDEILDLVMEREPKEWPALLDEACARDEELRREVESLLESHLQAEETFPSSALEAAISFNREDREGHEE